MNRPRISRRLALKAPIALAIGAAGCGRMGEDVLVVATRWAESSCRAIEADFARWSAQPGERADRPTRLVWVRLEPGDDPARRGDRLRGVDVILGGRICSYRRLASIGALASIAEAPAWRLARRDPIGIAVDPRAFGPNSLRIPAEWPDLGRAAFADRLAIGDPRVDPIALALARSRLRGRWLEGYAELVRFAANAPRILDGNSSAITEIERGRAALGPSTSSAGFVPIPGGMILEEGAGILRDARDLERAGSFLRFLSNNRGESTDHDGSDVVDLTADLLGATLVDAHEELRSAWSALIRRRESADSPSWKSLAAPPSWPPASIGRWKRSKGSEGLAETLAEQIASNPYDRAWLLESWDRAERPVEAGWIDEIAAVGSGRLAADARFRAWLRSEWAASARERYSELGRSTGARRA